MNSIRLGLIAAVFVLMAGIPLLSNFGVVAPAEEAHATVAEGKKNCQLINGIWYCEQSHNGNGGGGNGNGGGGNGNGGGGNGNGGGGNDNDDGDDDDGNGNKGDGNGNNGGGNGGGVLVPAPGGGGSAAAPKPVAPSCSSPGQDIVFASDDGRVAVRVFGNMPEGVRIRVRMPVAPGSVPPVPGTQVNGLLFELLAERCDGTALGELSREVNLGIRYSDGDVGGLNESQFKISLRDAVDNQWKAVDKQAADPPANYTSATITKMGFYVLHQPS